MRRLPWLVAVVVIAYLVVRAWQRPARKPSDPQREKPVGRPVVTVVAPGARGSGWNGVVIDAHDGAVIARAEIHVLIPSFEGTGIAASTHTDDAGRFRLGAPAELREEGAELEVRAAHHGTLRRKLPPQGQLAIALVARRRLLIERLVRWARGRGRPWADAGEPTPGEVVKVADRRGEPEVAAWARALQEAAYGPEEPDEPREHALTSMEPSSTVRER